MAMAELYLHVKDLENWELFQDMFSFQCMLLDNKMATQAGNYISIARDTIDCVVVKGLPIFLRSCFHLV